MCSAPAPGIVSKEDTLGAYAMIAALHEKRPGRQWRPLIDTTNDPIIVRPPPAAAGSAGSAREDYYNEGLLIWLDADAMLRELTGGRKSLDDFARAFFGPGDRDWGVSTYDLDDVVRTLNGVAPYDWAGFLKARVDDVATAAPLGWLARSGYRLTYVAEPTAYWKSEESGAQDRRSQLFDRPRRRQGRQRRQVIWDGPAFAAGITAGATCSPSMAAPTMPTMLKTAIANAATLGQADRAAGEEGRPLRHRLDPVRVGCCIRGWRKWPPVTPRSIGCCAPRGPQPRRMPSRRGATRPVRSSRDREEKHMSRIAKIEAADWDPELRAMFRADEATAARTGHDAHVRAPPGIAKG